MSTLAPPIATGDVEILVGAPMSYWRTVAWRLRRDPTTIVAGALLVLIALAAILAPVIAPHDPGAGSIRLRLAPIGTSSHPLGTDEQGRDMLTRLLWGGRMTLLAGLTPESVCRFERQRRGASVASIHRLAHVLTVPFAKLTGV